MIPKLISDDPKQQRHDYAYVYILQTLKLIKEARITELDAGVAARYLEEVHVHPFEAPVLHEQLLTNHRDVLQMYVIRKYLDVLENIAQYMRTQLMGADLNYSGDGRIPAYGPMPMSAESHKAIMGCLLEIFDNANFSRPRLEVSYQGVHFDDLYLVAQSLDLMASQQLGRMIADRPNQMDYWNPLKAIQHRTDSIMDAQLEVFVAALPQRLGRDILQCDLTQQSMPELSMVEKRIKFLAFVLSGLIHLTFPNRLRYANMDDLYKRLFASDEYLMGKMAKRYRPLGGLSINTAICLGDYTFLKHSPAPSLVDTAVERYLVLTSMAHHLC